MERAGKEHAEQLSATNLQQRSHYRVAWPDLFRAFREVGEEAEAGVGDLISQVDYQEEWTVVVTVTPVKSNSGGGGGAGPVA